MGGIGPVCSMLTTSEPILCGLCRFFKLANTALRTADTEHFFFPTYLHLLCPSFHPSLAQSLYLGGHTTASPRTPGRNVVLQPSPRACLDIKHQAATSTGLIQTSQFPVVCPTVHRARERRVKRTLPYSSHTL